PTATDEARVRLMAAGVVSKGRRTIITALPLDQIRPNPEQPRRYFDEQSLAELAESIRVRGLLQPVIVKRESDGRYLLLAGARRRLRVSGRFRRSSGTTIRSRSP